jgi:hypothetical protein
MDINEAIHLSGPNTEYTLPEVAQMLRMTENALTVYLSIHKERFPPKQYRTRPGKPGRYRVLSVPELIILRHIREAGQAVSKAPGPFDWRITGG